MTLAEAVVPTLAEDLRAARALIDTPEKFLLNGGASRACWKVAGSSAHKHRRLGLAFGADTREGWPLWCETIPNFGAHAKVLAQFDRAIAKAEEAR
jgi:hypothetical protein